MSKPTNNDAARDHLQTFPTAVLLAAARGEIDLNALARGELASRGLGKAGEWIGFPAAEKTWTVGGAAKSSWSYRCRECGEEVQEWALFVCRAHPNAIVDSFRVPASEDAPGCPHHPGEEAHGCAGCADDAHREVARG